jgi:hypothetical protein
MRLKYIFGSLVLLSLLFHSAFIPGSAQPPQATQDDNTIYLPLIYKYATRFNFSNELFSPPTTLLVWIQDINRLTGWVQINGADSQQPVTPFSWDWGDGTVEDGWFPRDHTYINHNENYILKVTAHYSGGLVDSTEWLIRFHIPVIIPSTLPTDLAVTIPDHLVALTTRLYPVPSNLSYFDDSFFTHTPRSTVEYILSVAASIQNNLTNGDKFLIDNGFRQVVLRADQIGGMYSLWFTNPPSFVSDDYGFSSTIQYSSFFHEMGHNFSLNSPANYYYGGKIDGNANAIYSESIANIYAHTTAYEILNHPADFGIPVDLEEEIKQNAIASMMVTRKGYEDYITAGMPFTSWNDPTVPGDETFGTFMTIAYKFCAHAEQAGQGYRQPLRRMMALLQKFNPDLLIQYDPTNNTPAANTFRATLMVASLSYAFSTDLRYEFRGLNFSISDSIYVQLMSMMDS